MPKNALVFVPHRPYPTQTGSHQSALMVIKALKEIGYQVSLFGSTLATDLPWEQKSIEYLQGELGLPVYLYQHDWLDAMYLDNQGMMRPNNWDQYNPPWFLDAFSNLYNKLKPDLVVVNYAWWGKLALGDKFRDTTRIIITLDSLTMNELMQRALGPHLKTPIDPNKVSPEILDEDFFERLSLEEKISEAQEYKIYDEYDGTIAFSAYDERITRQNTEQTWVHNIPITYPVVPVKNTYQNDPLLVMSNYSLNFQGYAYFAARVLPQILREQPKFNLKVIGKACENILPVEGVNLLGFVPELKPYYTEARFAICPVIGGTGMQVKIVEAMAHAVPVVALKNIAHSAPIEQGVNGFIAEDAQEFAEYARQLNADPSLCRKMGKAAQETIQEDFSPKVQAERWRAAISEAEKTRLKRLGEAGSPPKLQDSVQRTKEPLHPQILTFTPRETAPTPKKTSFSKRPSVSTKKSEPTHQRIEIAENTAPKISVITPTLNCAAYIEDCIESVLSQNYDNFEHIIIDGDSKDGTVAILKNYPHLKWISEPDGGEAEALNKGLRMASGDIIAWLNADDYYTPGALETAATLINPAAGRHAVYGKVILLGENELPIGVRVPTPNISLQRLLRWHRPLNLFQPAIFYSRQLMQTVGNYRQDSSYAVDLDYWIRVVRQGYQFDYIDRTFAKMRLVRKGGKTDTPYEVKDIDWLQACLETVSTLSVPERVDFWRDYYWHRIVNANLYPTKNLPEPTDREATLGLALAAIDTNAFEAAKDFLSNSIQKHPDFGDLYWLLGEAHYHLHLLQDAAEIFSGAETLRMQQDAQVKTVNEPKLATAAHSSTSIKRPAALAKNVSSQQTFDAAQAAKIPFGFNVISYVSGNLGVGVTARNVIQTIIDAGYPVAILDLDPGLGRGKYDLRFEEFAVDNLDELRYAVNLFITPLVDMHALLETNPELLSENRLNVSWNIWELSVVPPVWAKSLQMMDALVAESDFIRHTFDFSISGVKTITAPHPLALPEGIQPDREKFGLPLEGTIFITSFDPYSDPVRKNPEAVFAAFQQAVGDDQGAHLVLKLNNAKAGGEFHPAVQALQESCAAHPRIHLFTETLDYVDVLSLYASSDVYVSLHRAEGLGLGLMEAMMLGKPVVATAWSGNMSFMDHANACLVDYDLIPVQGSTLAYSADVLGGSAVWADAHVEEAAAWMKRLVDDPELREEIGQRAFQSISAFQENAFQANFITEICQIWENRVANAQILKHLSEDTLIQRAEIEDAFVDIVIPIYGQADLLERCVESVLVTTSDAHLILVDDQSPGPEIQALFERWKGHERITLVRTASNQGFIGTTKAGAILGSAENLLFLNSDTEAVEGGWLEALIPGSDDVAICGAKLVYPESMPGPLAGTIQHIGIARNTDGVPYHPYLGWSADIEQASAPKDVNAITGACFMIRRALWDEFGGWDERFGRGVYEDVDLCWQARKKGYKVLYQPGATLFHYESASTTNDGRHTLNENTQRNLKALLAKWKNISSDEKLFFGEKVARRWARGRRWVNRVRDMLAQDQFEQAISAMAEALSIAPDLPEALIGQAQMSSNQGHHEAAIENLVKAIQHSPANWDARFMLVDEYITAGDTQSAQIELAHLQAVFPDHPKILQRGEMLALFVEQDVSPEDNVHDPAQTLQMILEADDIIACLNENAAKLDRSLYDLVRSNADSAKSEGQGELASGLEDLAAYIEGVIAV